MPRANRHYLPGHVWHITHRCHKQEFLLKFGQAFNQRKGRKWAFWEDRYHATAAEIGEHLARCMVYVDIVRAGVVSHPSEWELRGYREIQSPPDRYRVID